MICKRFRVGNYLPQQVNLQDGHWQPSATILYLLGLSDRATMLLSETLTVFVGKMRVGKGDTNVVYIRAAGW
jgi:hypothetical protein